MWRRTVFNNFFNRDDPPQEVDIRVDGLNYNFFNRDDPPQEVDKHPDHDLPQEIDNRVDNHPIQWPVKKVLSGRDVNDGQLTIHRRQAKECIYDQLPPDDKISVDHGDHLLIRVRDCETEMEYPLQLWKKKDGSYVLTEGWKRCFVRQRGLVAGEEVGFRWDQELRGLQFTVLSRVLGQSRPGMEAGQSMR
ncbi:hypothetical protein NE237_013401 [Protea cynaroides]|uniref:TF-B3 domain-containing protein n=1 Tax=Protea cynaroides TaxID=273540 RepID=A0A9Q0H1M7_9MAGN|nr:hypothetical protein NE237_013401 [Protea cynaroides]